MAQGHPPVRKKQLLPSDLARDASEKRANPGIIVLTHQGQLLYRNREAAELCAVKNQASLGQEARGVLPTEVINLCRNIADLMRVVTDVKDWKAVISAACARS
jgi:hypothetical protein